MSTISASTTTTTAYKVTADTTGTLVLQTGATPTTAVTIDGSQNVGIGKSSPDVKTDILGGANTALRIASSSSVATTAGAAYCLFGGANNINSGYLGYVGVANQMTLMNGLVGEITFGTSNTERARIDSSGNLLVGTTSSNVFSPNNGIALLPSSSTSGGATISIGHASGTSNGYSYTVFNYAGGAIGSISQNGTTGVLYNLTSDYRLKNDQQPLTGAKEFVMALQPKKWQWWDGSGEGVGFIAHEFMEVAKYSGHGEKDAVDEEGNIIPQSIQPSSSEVMANLVAFIQELKAELDAAKADIATLKGAA